MENTRKLHCGGVAIPDRSGEMHGEDACFSRCNQCFAVIGSVGMPSECRKMMEENA